MATRLGRGTIGAAVRKGRPSSSEQEGTGLCPGSTRHVATATTQVKILVPGHQSMVTLLGQRDSFLKQIEKAFAADVLVRGNEITITGRPEVTEQVGRVFEELLELLEQGLELSEESVGQTIAMVSGAEAAAGAEGAPRPSEVLGDNLLSARGKKIAPKTFGQKRYVDAIRRSTVTFAIGPAGTGKTYLAVAVAVRALQERQVSRLILTRPAVEAGERLGFLPGTLYEKIDPYPRPRLRLKRGGRIPETAAELPSISASSPWLRPLSELRVSHLTSGAQGCDANRRAGRNDRRSPL